MTDPSVSNALPTKEERNWAIVAHLSGLLVLHFAPVVHIVAPLMVWLIKRDTGAFFNEQGKEALNAQISFVIYAFIAGLLCFVFIGFPLLFGLYVANIIFGILAALAVSEGRPYRYPYILRLVK